MIESMVESGSIAALLFVVGFVLVGGKTREMVNQAAGKVFLLGPQTNQQREAVPAGFAAMRSISSRVSLCITWLVLRRHPR